MIWSIFTNQYVRRWLVMAGAILGVMLWGQWRHHKGYELAQSEYELAAKIEAARHSQELKDAEHVHDGEIADLKAYRDSHPLPVVRLCPRPAVQAPASAGNSAGTTGGDVQPLPNGDSAVRADGNPDIADLLSLFALRADEVSASLREEQAVH